MKNFLKIIAVLSVMLIATPALAGHVSVGVAVGGFNASYSEGYHGYHGYRGYDGYRGGYRRGVDVVIAPAPRTVYVNTPIIRYDEAPRVVRYEGGYYRRDDGVEYVPTYCYDSWGRQYFCGYRPSF